MRRIFAITVVVMLGACTADTAKLQPGTNTTSDTTDIADGTDLHPFDADISDDVDGVNDTGVDGSGDTFDGDVDDASEDADTCTCSGTNACCDGCHPINEDGACDDENTQTGDDRCQSGACIGRTCECYDASDPCCDGCMFEQSGTVCGDAKSIEYRCESPGALCGGTLYREEHRYVCTGDASACIGGLTLIETTKIQCSPTETCKYSSKPTECRESCD